MAKTTLDFSLLESVELHMSKGSKANPKETKKNLLRLALLSALRNGKLNPGDRLPSEQAMTQALGLSAGTIQGALRQLQDLGLIIRRRGDGTVVADAEPISDTIWHFRFVHKISGRPCRPNPTVIKIEQVDDQGLWTRHLGPPPYIRISRRLSSDGIQLGAMMYLPYDLVDIENLQLQQLDGINLRVALESQLGEHAQRDATSISHTRMDYILADLFEMIPGSDVLVTRATTRLTNGNPFYYQEIFAPAELLELQV